MVLKLRRSALRGITRSYRLNRKIIYSWPQWKKDLFVPGHRKGEIEIGNVCQSLTTHVGVVTRIKVARNGQKIYLGRSITKNHGWQSKCPEKLAQSVDQYRQLYQNAV